MAHLATCVQGKFQEALNLAHSGGGAASEQVIEAYFGLVSGCSSGQTRLGFGIHLAGSLVLSQLASQLLKVSKKCTCYCTAQAECLQSWAQAVLDVCSSLPDAELSPATEQAAYAQASGLFQRAVQAYKQVRGC